MIFVQCWSNPRIKYFKIRHWKTTNRWRRSQIIHWINQLHFFDPLHSFRREWWTSAYLSAESHLPINKRCQCGEFVEMKIWNLQSLLVCFIILYRVCLTKDDCIFVWRSWLASLILNWCLILILPRLWGVNWFWYVRTPWIQFLRIRCWRRRGWICKNVSRYTMCVPTAWRPCPKCLAAHLQAKWSSEICSFRSAQNPKRISGWLSWLRVPKILRLIIAAEQSPRIALRWKQHLLCESAPGVLLLNLREDEGQEEVLEDKDEERRKVMWMKRSRKSERTPNSCMRHGDDHGMEIGGHANILSQCAMCKGWVWQQQKQRLTTKTATTTHTLTCSPNVSSHCTHCWVSCWSCASCRQWCSCRCNRLLNFDLYPNSWHNSHRENGSFKVLSSYPTSIAVDRR